MSGPHCGISIYTRGLLSAFKRLPDDNVYYLYSHRPAEFDGDERFVARTGSGMLARKGNLWVQTRLVDAAMDDRLNVFFGPLQILPLRLPGKIRTVLAIHDLVHMTFPWSMSLANYLVLRMLLPPSAAKADALITGSSFIREQIRTRLKPSGKEIHVVYHGLPGNIKRKTKEEALGFMSQAYNVNGPYVLFVGVVEPRKNVKTLLQAFKLLREKHGWNKVKLVIAGTPGWRTRRLDSEVQRLRVSGDVVFTGSVSGRDLNLIYSGADVFVFPSLYEGFGFPPLEAMATGVPVICSDSSSLPEIAGNAAVMVPPRDPEWMASQMSRLLGNRRLGAELAARGEVQAGGFSWDRAARRTLEIFRETASLPRKALRPAGNPQSID